MRQSHNDAWQRIGKALQAQFDRDLSEPLPQRWIDVLNWLNDEGQAEGEVQMVTDPRNRRLSALRR